MADERLCQRVWVVVCGAWSYNDEFDVGGETPIKAFTSREKAEAYVRAWEEYHATPLGRNQLMCGQATVDYQIVELDMNEWAPRPEEHKVLLAEQQVTDLPVAAIEEPLPDTGPAHWNEDDIPY
jgi:hypothetical protein